MKTEKKVALHKQPSTKNNKSDTNIIPQNDVFTVKNYANGEQNEIKKDVEQAKEMYAKGDVPTFPLNCLPKVLAAFIQETAESMPCPVDYVGLSVLVTLGTAIGNSAEIQIDEDWTESTLLWGCIVGDPSALKTPALASGTKPLEDLQKQNYELYEARYEEYQDELRNYEQWRKKKSNDEEPPFPTEPTFEQFIINDTTMEAVAQVVEDNPRGVLSSHDELIGFVNSMNQYRAGGADRQKWLSIYGRKSFSINRVSKRPKYVHKPFVSVIGNLTPDSLDKIVSTEQDGFADRFLYVYPKKVPAYYQEKTVNPVLKEQYEKLTIALLNLHKDINNPLIVRYSKESKILWKTFNDYIVHMSESPDFPKRLESVFGKFRGILSRITLILHLIKFACGETADKETVDKATIAEANAITQYFIEHAKKVYRLTQASDQDKHFAKVIEFVKKRGELSEEGNGYRVSVQEMNRYKVFSNKTNKELVMKVLYDMQEENLGQVEMVEGYQGKTKFYFTLFRELLT